MGTATSSLSFWPNDAPKLNVSEVVLDSSVLIAILKREPYEANLLGRIDGSVMSSVNYAELIKVASDIGMHESTHLRELLGLVGRIEPFTVAQALTSGLLRTGTLRRGLSLGDRACLALALELGAEVYTADRVWAGLDVGCPIHLIR